jgi:hypothetical protein
MGARLTKLGVALAALAALAVGGSAYVSAGTKAAPPAQPPAATQSQQGDQSAPDNSAEAPSGAADTDNVQQGDQSAPDNAAESQNESAGSESGPSDGPGGYADSNANADTQQQGEH